ncbi:MAG: hypothetical protein IKU42_01750 [Oscillospiraceae bacterium]|nr:hypothetical protein [Oscillospiraceae bacterium]
MKKKIISAIAVLLILWLSAGITDFIRVTRNFEKPIFCISTETADDGGSGKYIGLGYSFDIKGNFMPEDEFPGVVKYEAKILGITVSSEARE